ncbi:MAG: NAD(P)(+) transhydrogenase (Re/Si-specific) subunit alpha [Planctomycetaceae bacterium]|nr:NAD(P)(+) transhydrogenase (Re/Si-specific) subunit alpha [Planctomycetaceae bacterium]
MKVAVPKEIVANERRVAATPRTVAKMVKLGITVSVQAGAGTESSIADSEYEEVGASIESNLEPLLGAADVVVKVQPPLQHESAGKHELELLKPDTSLICILQPLTNHDVVRQLADKRITSFSLDLLPRIARAQAMDVLSSMSTLAGYKAVLLAANALKTVLPMLTTAAGTLYPAKALILGAGVAGLQAIATARRLGAVVKAFDVRPVVKEQVESLGAEFIELGVSQDDAEDAGGYAKEQAEDTQRRTLELIAEHARESDIVITTALIPGKKAPILITEDMIKQMKSGSVVVDLAAEAGGNCELSELDQSVVKHDVTLIGYANLPSTLPSHASLMYANNVSNFLLHLHKDGQIAVNLEDEITKGTLITHQGEVVHDFVKGVLGGE